ncbi:protein tesmin/TSO1-like CXC 3 isoform X2 [Phoenix dactylifera]|uniref:Protein tesmin/TSO1-like CXC 3 isoform X2 n=1 Tax=Phoenix dactylifera TaxID=42345 RepID=A0A8B8ZJR6_PHODC|nr:protein tesmin/TSO1-like CXC 3 isoform X2 [Phoenix dactylifera]
MDTPERSKIGGTPVSKFEDSPVFNFINSLSPIQPVKSVDSVHSVQSYLPSVSSIFASPHANPQRESRFLIRNSSSDFSKDESSSDNVDESNLCTGVLNAVRLSRCTVIARESCSIICSLNEATVDPPDECSTLPSNVPQPEQYNSGSPNHNTTPWYGIKMDVKLDIDHAPVELVPFVQNGLDKRKSLLASESEFLENYPLEQNKDEVVGCNWVNLIPDNADGLLSFDSNNESEACKGPSEELGDSSKPAEGLDNSHKTQLDESFGPCVKNAAGDPPVICSAENGKEDETDHTLQILSGTCQKQVLLSDQTQKMANGTSDQIQSGHKVDSQQQRGMRRRCLVFDMAGISKKNLQNNSYHHSSSSSLSDEKMASDDKCSRPGTSQAPCVLPGIGLHLNTLATTSKERPGTKEMLASGKELISMPCPVGPFGPTTSGWKGKSLAVEKDASSTGNEVQNLHIMHDDASQSPVLGNGEELNQVSPKKKRRKSENGVESEACKRCNCKKSKCLKLYCECFAAGVYCSEPCSCQGCFNKLIHVETVLATRKQIESRNPLAFAPKVIRTSETGQEMGEDANKTPASARHKRGCNCKKSSCLKKYCECYQGGVGCSISCRCEGCKNAFGRKEGIVPIGAEEIDQGEDKTDHCERDKDKPDDDGQQHASVQIDDNHSSEGVLSVTPLETCRPSVKLSFFSSAKPPRSSTLSVGLSPWLYTSQPFRKSEIPLLHHKLEKHVNNVLEDDTPDALRCDASPSNGVKTASPNRKRVSPPHNGIELLPSCKGGRKVVVKLHEI